MSKKEEKTMASQPNQFAKQVKSMLTKLKPQNSPRPNTSGKKDDLIPAKDKSPDDLEIFD